MEKTINPVTCAFAYPLGETEVMAVTFEHEYDNHYGVYITRINKFKHELETIQICNLEINPGARIDDKLADEYKAFYIKHF